MIVIDGEFFYYHSDRCRRLSVDIDSLRSEPLKVLRVFYRLKSAFPQAVIHVEQTLHGFHVKAIGECFKTLSPVEKLDIRESLGDCADRVAHDRLSIHLGVPFFADTLFTVKFHSTGEKTIVQAVNPIALPWSSRVPAAKRSAKSSASFQEA